MATKKDEELGGGYVAKGTYFDAGLSDADKAAVSDLGRQWAEAQKAGDQAKMDAAHAAAEAIRAGYGYSGGGDGSEYIALPKETKVSGGGGSDVTSRRFSYESAPTYTNKYQSQIDDLTRQILGRAAFEYDPEKDPTYQQYKESYTRNGERAMQDTLGQVSARTGGLASSYAGAAAQQTYDGYMSALADKIPELKQLAYQMYRDQGADQRANLEMLMALEQGDYNKYLTLLGQYNTDRGFDYGVFSDQRAFDYGVQRDQVADSQWQQTFDRGVLESDRAFSYQQGRDQIADQRYEQEYKDSRADVEWQRLNYANETEYNRALQKAQVLAAAGDFSGYKAMGYSDSEVANLKTAYTKAQQVVSPSKSGSGDTTVDPYKDSSFKQVLSYLQGVKKDGGSADDAADYLEMMELDGFNPEWSSMAFHAAGFKDDDVSVPESIPTTYKEFAARTGQSGIYTEREFSQRKGSKGYVTAYGVNCKTYQDYLNLMWEKYKK